MQWIDVSAPMEPELAVWPGDPEFQLNAEQRVGDGASCNVSSINISLHTGTHIDSPWHFEDDGKRTHEIDTQLYFGDAEIRDLRGRTAIGAQDLGTESLPERLLLLTDIAGVLDKDKNLLTRMIASDVATLIADGTIAGGMIPKVETCLSAVQGGVGAAVILDGRVPHALLLELFTEHGAGTLIGRDS